jgi:murein DD-endopeptidase MepM/ murein hydrolase activator NlpD
MGLAAAGCSNSARFDSNPFDTAQAPRQEMTGPAASRPMSRVEARPLPTPNRPAYAQQGYASGAQGQASYRPERTQRTAEYTASAHRGQSAGRWTWDGGSPVTVAHGETVEMLARKYGVPATAIRETNGFRDGVVLRTGQRVVIPRYVAANAAQSPASPAARPVRNAENVHVVEPGETLTSIAHKNGVPLAALARANHIQPYTKVSMGERLTIPGGHRTSEHLAQAQAPRVAEAHSAAPIKVASVPVESARVATPETHAPAQTPAKIADAVGAIPSFRWPVKGRIIASFGPRPNGGQNDGINLAVPEGTPVKAADDGVVAYAGNELKGYGNLVLIRHANGFVSAYANASELLVKRGDTVKRGQVIAHAGQTGNVTSPQLHFEIRKGSTPVDPTKYLGGA